MISPTGFVHITNIDVGEFLKRKIAKFLKFRNLTILYVIQLVCDFILYFTKKYHKLPFYVWGW